MVGCDRQASSIHYSYCCWGHNYIGDLKTDTGKSHSPHKASQQLRGEPKCMETAKDDSLASLFHSDRTCYNESFKVSMLRKKIISYYPLFLAAKSQ